MAAVSGIIGLHYQSSGAAALSGGASAKLPSGGSLHRTGGPSVGAGVRGPSPPSLSRTVDKVLDDSQYTGEINLSGRKLKEFPHSAAKYDLVDTSVAGRGVNPFYLTFHRIHWNI